MIAPPSSPRAVWVREAESTDLAAIGSLHAWSKRATYRSILPPGATDDIKDDNSHASWRARMASAGTRRLLVAESGSEILGFGLVTAEADSWATLNALHVRPDLHGFGIGTTLLEALLDAARGWGRSQAFLFVLAQNHGARGFYAQHGWTLVGDGPEHAIAGHSVDTLRYTISLT